MALILDLQPQLLHEDLETLMYMTRSESYDFQTSLDDSFFTACDQGFDDEWRRIIANNQHRMGEESFSETYNQTRRSVFLNNQLCFRILIDDDTYDNTWWAFSEWLFSISTSEGLVGYLLDVLDLTRTEPDLIYFEKAGMTTMTTRSVKNCTIPNSLMHSINELLGGSDR
ncbi:hypothetical protein ACKFKG_03430 [Phormidesmis sp. 146-35]